MQPSLIVEIRKADSLQAWHACRDSLTDVAFFINGGACIFTSGSDKSAAVWVLWRKSNTSKQLLGLVGSVLEAVAAGANRQVPAACTASKAIGLRGSITIASYFNTASAYRYGVLWPALREWLMEQGGMDIGHHVEGAGMGAGGGMRRGAGSGYRLSAGGNANARASMLLDTWPKPLCAVDPLPQARPPALMIVSSP